MQHKHPLLLCDLDGTLIDSREDLATGVNLMRAEYGLAALPVDTVTRYVGDGARKLVERALQGSDVSHDEALEKFKNHYRDNMFVKTSLYHGVKEGLHLLHGHGWKIALTSNKPSDKCEDILRHFKVDSCFDLILGGSHKYPLKPEPESIMIAMKETGAHPDETWIIGDNHTDLEAGRRACIKRCYARYGFGHIGSEDFDMVVDSFMEFVESQTGRRKADDR
ncbi:MAG TPA: hypothetical protein DET40_09935 [Lentisphaeria bacterium]|nr:MAG: hypothetical protein A2X45_08720 [Lentisphaerae bacterium GWF2_50_93]HCE43855.1 hypothetical protein [Lentisphaeria bacterium]